MLVPLFFTLFLGIGQALIQEITDEYEPKLKELMESNGEAFVVLYQICSY